MEENSPKNKSAIKQIFILLTMVAISSLEGFSPSYMQTFSYNIFVMNLRSSYDWLYETIIPLVGFILLTTIGQYCGRKAALAVFIILTVTAQVLSLFKISLCLWLAGLAASLSSGGRILLFNVYIAEYCEPKSRLVATIAAIAANMMGCKIMFLVNQLEFMTGKELLLYVQYFVIVLATVCLFHLLTWPESPYWLALKGRQVSSMNSFSVLWSDRTASENELKATLEFRDRSFSIKMFCVQLFTTIMLYFTYWCSISLYFAQKYCLFNVAFGKSLFMQVVSVECGIILILYKVFPLYYAYSSIARPLALVIYLISQYAFIVIVITTAKECAHTSMSGPTVPNVYDITFIIFAINYILMILGPVVLFISKFAEQIPLQRRSLFVYISGISYFLIKQFHSYLSDIFRDTFGLTVQLLVLSILLLFGIVLTCILVPATEGKTLTEIQHLYLSKWRQNDACTEQSDARLTVHIESNL